MPDLGDLCRAAVEGARGDEAVEAYAEESRHTEASALRGQIEGLTFAESRGVGVRLIADGRLGYAYAADPTVDEVRAAVERARENAALAEPDEFNLLPAFEPAAPIEGLYREDQADISTDRKVGLALDLERRLVSIDPRVTKIDVAQIGDAVSRVAIASTTGVRPSTPAPTRGASRWRSRSRATRRRRGSRSRSPGGSTSWVGRRSPTRPSRVPFACWARPSRPPRRCRWCWISSPPCRSWACWPGRSRPRRC